MKLDKRTAVLVAIGAAAAVNCHDCLRRLRERAAAAAVGPQEMAAAAEEGLRVSRAAGDQTGTFASEAFGATGANRPDDHQPAAADPAAGQAWHGCCGTSDERRCLR